MPPLFSQFRYCGASQWRQNAYFPSICLLDSHRCILILDFCRRRRRALAVTSSSVACFECSANFWPMFSFDSRHSFVSSYCLRLAKIHASHCRPAAPPRLARYIERGVPSSPATLVPPFLCVRTRKTCPKILSDLRSTVKLL